MKNIFKNGDAYVWLSGVSLMFSLLMIIGLVSLIAVKGMGYFWPSDVVKLTMKDGSVYMGQYSGRQKIPEMTEARKEPGIDERIQLKIGNRDIYGLDFKWFDVDDIDDRTYPDNAIVLERLEWGNFIGFLEEIRTGDEVIRAGEDRAYPVLKDLIREANRINDRIDHIERGEIGDINYKMENYRLEIKGLMMEEGKNREQVTEVRGRIAELQEKYEEYEEQLLDLYNKRNENKVVLRTVNGVEEIISAGELVRAFKPNAMGFFEKCGHYISKVWEFVSENPREANTEGGIFPAIFGTVMMVLIMSIVVMPFGVIAALYLREYAKQGTMVRIVRICVNNLAGVPSIVYGVFGVGFFIYGLGGLIDSVFYQEALPNPTFGTGGILWASLTLALLTLPVVIVATEEGLAAVPRNLREGSLALGATKFETIWKVVIPSALPAILTGLILAIARATGEVAPLMITGVVKLAPELPLDGNFPFLHLDRKFMHMGFHIYDVGFQSPNVEAAKPMVFTTALLLIMIVIALNLTAIVIRNKLKKRYSTSGV